jgi:hypothetical protein
MEGPGVGVWSIEYRFDVLWRLRIGNYDETNLDCKIDCKDAGQVLCSMILEIWEVE